MKKLLIVMLLIAGLVENAKAQGWNVTGTTRNMATLTIQNKSEYSLTVKIMYTNRRGIYQTVFVSPHSSRCVIFSRSDNFYTKTKAEKDWSGTLYKRGGVFQIQNDETGYSEATLEFYVSSYGSSSGDSISKSEFESNE